MVNDYYTVGYTLNPTYYSLHLETNSLITGLAVVLVCILVFLTLIMATVVVICLIFKKGKRNNRLPEHVYDSVSLPPSTHSSLSEARNLDYEEVEMTSHSTTTQFDLTDNVAYNSFKPPAAAAPNTYNDEVKTTSDSTTTQFELTDNVAYNSFKPPSAAETNPNTESSAADLQ